MKDKEAKIHADKVAMATLNGKAKAAAGGHKTNSITMLCVI